MRQYLATCRWSACFSSFNRTLCIPMISSQSPRGIKEATLVPHERKKKKKKTSTPVSSKKKKLPIPSHLRLSLHSMRTYLIWLVRNTYICRL